MRNTKKPSSSGRAFFVGGGYFIDTSAGALIGDTFCHHFATK
jgi:hypothetical protein